MCPAIRPIDNDIYLYVIAIEERTYMRTQDMNTVKVEFTITRRDATRHIPVAFIVRLFGQLGLASFANDSKEKVPAHADRAQSFFAHALNYSSCLYRYIMAV